MPASMTYLSRRWVGLTFRLGTDDYVAYSGSVTSTSPVTRNPSPLNGTGTDVGTLNHGLRTVTLTTWPTGISPVVTNLNGAAVAPTSGSGTLYQSDAILFRTANAPVAPSGFTILGTFADDETDFNVTADEDGFINDDDVLGTINYQTGVVELHFGTPTVDPVGSGVVDLSDLGIPGVTNVRLRPVQADSLRYNAVTYSYIPLDAGILGLDPVRLPADGRVPIFRPGTVAVVHHEDALAPQTVSNAQTVSMGRTRVARIKVVGNDGNVITAGYTVNLVAGTITFTDVTGYSQPVTISNRIEDAALVAEAQISGLIRFTRPITHNYPADESYISSALLIGDMFARVSTLYDQGTWTNVWSDDLIGSIASASYDDINYPAEVTNRSAVTERWALVFTNSTTFNIIGEHLGLIGTGNTTLGAAPLNPATGDPYFELNPLGFGSGWSAGNVVRLNTVGAQAPVWAARVVLQSEPTEENDSFTMLVRGDVDTP